MPTNTWALNHFVRWQASFHFDSWKSLSKEELKQIMRDQLAVVSYYAEFLGSPDSSKLIGEIGAGRGGLLGALKQSGYRVLGCEPSSGLVQMGINSIGLADSELLNCTGSDFIDRCVVDSQTFHAIFLWHVLEHMSGAVSFLRHLKRIIKPGGYVIAQGPLLASRHIFPAHLFLHTPESVLRMSELCGASLVDQNFSPQEDYMGFVLRF